MSIRCEDVAENQALLSSKLDQIIKMLEPPAPYIGKTPTIDQRLKSLEVQHDPAFRHTCDIENRLGKLEKLHNATMKPSGHGPEVMNDPAVDHLRQRIGDLDAKIEGLKGRDKAQIKWNTNTYSRLVNVDTRVEIMETSREAHHQKLQDLEEGLKNLEGQDSAEDSANQAHVRCIRLERRLKALESGPSWPAHGALPENLDERLGELEDKSKDTRETVQNIISSMELQSGWNNTIENRIQAHESNRLVHVRRQP
jgi:hypothetical protein